MILFVDIFSQSDLPQLSSVPLHLHLLLQSGLFLLSHLFLFPFLFTPPSQYWG